MRKPSRLYTAQDMANGVQVVHGLGLKAIQANPTAMGPLAALQQAEPAPEMAEGHCFGCQDKKQFTVAKKTQMKNGAIQASGPCAEPGCSATVSTIMSGASSAPAA